MSKRTIKINIKLPAGVVATKELTEKATNAAKTVVDASIQDLAEVSALAKDLAKKGITISAEELLSRKSKSSKSTATKTKKASKKASPGAKKRTRVVLSDAQKQKLIADLKAGAKVSEASAKYGVSTATVMNIKTAAGLTKSRKS